MSYRNHSGLAKTLSNQFLGLAIGFVVAAALIVVQRMVPSLEPLWADYEPLANYCPIFAIITKNLTGYLLSSSVIYIILIGLDYYVRMNKWYRILFVVVGLTLAAKLAIGSVASWLTIGLALGILLLAAYEYLLKYDLALTFVAVGAYSITQVAQQIIFNAIPAAPLGGIISCIFIGALASYFFKKL
jgi:type IV secretory pathway VirB2 component (pilin)